MSATTIISQLKSLLVKAEEIPLKLSKIYPTDGQWDILSDLGMSFSEAAKSISSEIQVLMDSRAERAWKDSEPHRLRAQTLQDDLFANGRLKHAHVFRRNIVTIFQGPKDSNFDTEDMKSRKASTRKRCEQIRGLSPDGVVSWAMALPPSVWAGGAMASDIFTCLLDDIDPELIQPWPQTIRKTLHALREDEESLQKSLDYDNLLKAVDNWSRKPVHQKKRKRIEDDQLEGIRDDSAQVAPADSLPPPEETREMKHIYTNGPADHISKMPEPFRTSVQNSRLWKWERGKGLKTTGCWPSLFPQDHKQDVSFTIWCSHEDGYRLNDIFGSQLALSS